MIRRFFQQDNLLFGVILGIIVPAIVLGILYVIIIIPFSNANGPIIKPSTLQLLAIFTNLATMRYYLLKLKFDYTGRGILLATMILAIVYFAIYL